MKKRALIYIVIAGVLWGTSRIFFKLLKLYGFLPIQMTAMRGVVSGIVMFSCNGISVFDTAGCYYVAIDVSSVSSAVMLMYTAPVFVMVY